MSNEGGEELLEIINDIYTRYDAEGAMPGTLNGIKNSVFNDMSHYNYETIQLHLFEDSNVDVIGITKYLFPGMYKESIYLQQGAIVKCYYK